MADPATMTAPPPVVVNGFTLQPGTEVSVRGERGRFRYIDSHTTTAGLLVLNFVGGPTGREMYRSFYPGKIRTVHRRTQPRKKR